jgi:DNA adenine methylase
VGSGAFFFAAAPNDAILSDANSELILTYRSVRRDPDAVADIIATLPQNRPTFLRLRGAELERLDATSRAARFIFLNRFCFNGLYRTNLKGTFNVPFAPAKTGRLPDRAHLRAVASRLGCATLLQGDFETVIQRVVQAGDFVYLDPPYAVENRRIFRQYNANTFGFDDLHRLAALLHSLDALGATFVLSYALCAESLHAFRDWPHARVMALRNIAGFAAHRRRSAELLVTNCPS